MSKALSAVSGTLDTLADSEKSDLWWTNLRKVADLQGTSGLVTGKACRLLLDGRAMTVEEAGDRFRFAASRASEPKEVAQWVEGFLSGSGLLLIHNPALWDIVDGWVSALPGDHFIEVLPLLRRTFSRFAPAERRQMGERVGKRADDKPVAPAGQPQAAPLNPLLGQMLGIKGKKP
jgi:hypothetical protein